MTEQNEHHTFKADEIPCQEISDPAVLSKNPLVSVKMITYNHRPYIAQAIEGVVKQETEYPFELIIGEDCSTDSTREIVFDYQKRYPHIVRVITSAKNVGAKRNSFRTNKACRGKYIAFCEGDDYWHRSDKLKLQIGYLEAHPKYGLVYSDYNCHFVERQKTVESYNKYKKRNLPVNPTMTDFVLGRGGILGGLLTCTVVVRRHLLEQIIQADPYLHDGTNFLMGDTQKWAEISEISKIHYIDESLAVHNILIESATRSKNRERRLKFYISGTKMLLYLCEKYSLPKEVCRFQEQRWCEFCFDLAFLERNLRLANLVMNQCHKLSFKYVIKYYSMKKTFFYVLLKNALALRRRLLPDTEGFSI